MTTLQENLLSINTRIANAAQRAGRSAKHGRDRESAAVRETIQNFQAFGVFRRQSAIFALIKIKSTMLSWT